MSGIEWIASQLTRRKPQGIRYSDPTISAQKRLEAQARYRQSNKGQATDQRRNETRRLNRQESRS